MGKDYVCFVSWGKVFLVFNATLFDLCLSTFLIRFFSERSWMAIFSTTFYNCQFQKVLVKSWEYRVKDTVTFDKGIEVHFISRMIISHSFHFLFY